MGSFAFTVFPQPARLWLWSCHDPLNSPMSSLCNLCRGRCWGCNSDALQLQPSCAKNVHPMHLSPQISKWWEHIHKPCLFPNVWAICKANFMERTRIELSKPPLKTKWDKKHNKRIYVWGRSTFCSVVEDHIENNFNALTMKLSLMQKLLKRFQTHQGKLRIWTSPTLKRKIMENHLQNINSRAKPSSFFGTFREWSSIAERESGADMMSQASNHGFESNNGSTNPIS